MVMNRIVYCPSPGTLLVAIGGGAGEMHRRSRRRSCASSATQRSRAPPWARALVCWGGSMGGRGRRSAMLVLHSMRAAEGLSDLCVCVCVRACSYMLYLLGCSSCRCGAIPSGRAVEGACVRGGAAYGGRLASALHASPVGRVSCCCDQAVAFSSRTCSSNTGLGVVVWRSASGASVCSEWRRRSHRSAS